MTSLVSSSPLTTRGAHEAGHTPEELRERVDQGRLVRPFRGVYLEPSSAESAETRALAVAALIPPSAALARETAAWVHGIDVRPPQRYRSLPLLEVVNPADRYRNGVRREGVLGHVADLPPADVMEIGGLPVTTPLRTALDLARYSEPYMGLAAVDMFAHQGLIELAELRHRALLLPGRRHIARARYVIGLADHRSESAGESWSRLRLAEAGLPLPDLQIPLFDDAGRERFRLDMGYREQRLAIEYDGIDYHFANQDQAEHDTRRRALIEEEYGWRVLGVHAGDVLGRQPSMEQAVAEILGVTPVGARRRWR